MPSVILPHRTPSFIMCIFICYCVLGGGGWFDGRLPGLLTPPPPPPCATQIHCCRRGTQNGMDLTQICIFYLYSCYPRKPDNIIAFPLSSHQQVIKWPRTPARLQLRNGQDSFTSTYSHILFVGCLVVRVPRQRVPRLPPGVVGRGWGDPIALDAGTALGAQDVLWGARGGGGPPPPPPRSLLQGLGNLGLF